MTAEKRRAKTTREFDFVTMLKGCFKALLCALGAALLVSLLLCFVAYKSENPTSFICCFGMATAAASALTAGFAAAKINGQSIAASAFTAGCMLLFVMIVMSFIFGGGNSLFTTLAMYGGVILLSLLGGAAGKPRPKKHRRKK